jgi:chromosome segregation ATPase
MVDIGTQMNKIEIALQAEKAAEAIKEHVKGVADTIKEYVRKEIEALEERLTDKLADAAETKEYVRREEPEEVDPRLIHAPGPRHVQANKFANADAGTLAELSGTVRNLERRAGRHAEHLANLQASIRVLEGKKNEPDRKPEETRRLRFD